MVNAVADLNLHQVLLPFRFFRFLGLPHRRCFGVELGLKFLKPVLAENPGPVDNIVLFDAVVDLVYERWLYDKRLSVRLVLLFAQVDSVVDVWG